MRIAYWTTACLEPEHEAVSQEVARLSAAFPGAWVFAVSRHILVRASLRGRYLGLHARAQVIWRAAIPALERAFDINHVYGDMTPWVFHKALRKRPIIHTVTQDSGSPVLPFLERSEAIVVQTEATQAHLLALGLPAAKVHLRRPGIDLKRFRPEKRLPSSGTPRILFCTSPRSAEELESRGVHLLLDAAGRSKTARFRLLYRVWKSGYTSLRATREAIRERALSNVDLSEGQVGDMPGAYGNADFTVIPFAGRSGGKECPNSALESLACGVPVLVSRACPFAEFIEKHGCGVAFDPDPAALSAAIAMGLEKWAGLSAAARRAAEEHFDAAETDAFYRRLYAEVSSPGATRHFG